MPVLPQHQVSVNVNDVFAVQRKAVSCLVFFAYALRKKPVQNTKVNMHRLQLPTIKLQIPNCQTIFEMVKLDKPAIMQGYSEVFAAQLPDVWNL
jgi:hypothetical protein